MSLKGKVLVLNQNYEPLNICTVRRAITLLYLGKAETVITYNGEKFRSEKLAIERPSVVKLFRYIRVKRREIPLTKKNILRRDNYTCQYCGTREGPMTVDHVIPKRLGGEDSWENLVCACLACNNKKGDRTPEEAGMKLLRKPRRPNYFIFMFNGQKIPDERWKPFLFME
ncbi:MAG: HNH endonuclease [Candidatus Hydrothermae bacterium]|uniref:HNH endonuclease n=1 Tax=candidate division WOR-3 bacterium TaxID=2052148 RepID=A0A7C1BFB1_UNCW3|nr:HNH endonuclease [Candidatus Hydrothermae bacterium]RKY95338.1 MAG: HNH endonuclease [Candidatus Hydrothermae bacterium]RKZ03675.1 MAG: HNH endonuclease [Candidatus Hydrothermae bacterium]HDM89668.1 HNH endonuclease [candidate division WOR-3 bacterium]